MSGPLAAYWPYFELNHEVDFDGPNRLITIAPDITDIDIKRDLYSASKEWLQVGDNTKYPPPMRAVGGDLLPGGNPLGSTFFMTNGWRIVLDHAVSFVGNMYSDNYPNAFVVTSGVQLAYQSVSNLVNVVETTNATGLAATVWQALAADHVTAATMGAKLNSLANAADPWTIPLDGVLTAADLLQLAATSASDAWTAPIEGSLTAAQLLRLIAAANAGKISGADGLTVTIRDVSDTKNRIVADVDADGNRLAITLDVT